ncbi:ATP-binding protein [bacterium]|nr:ATP-binding protein [bacterium]
MFIQRQLKEKLLYLATKYPVTTLTGARQCGKSTLLKDCFPDYKYISLEDLDIRQIATNDPRGFLKNFGSKLIIDEAQYVPTLFSYIQTIVDTKNEPGMFILSGSQNFLLLESITQSLAGRTAVLRLNTFSIAELSSFNPQLLDLNKLLFTGGYPRIYDFDIQPTDFYPSYIQTYIERDIRVLRNINDLGKFIRFLKLCAARTGQLLNVASLANEAEITVPTVNAWLSILESSYIIYLLKPYYRNYNKRLIKSPKLYFHDTGLAASLLGLTSSEQLSTHYLRGELFENLVISEYIKSQYTIGVEPSIYFWRDSNQNEVDLLVEINTQLQAIEIKSSATINSSFFKTLKTFQSLSNINSEFISVVYGGDIDYQTENGRFVSWKNMKF